jgi:lipopolysaccharide transport system ATP-binding protein
MTTDPFLPSKQPGSQGDEILVRANDVGKIFCRNFKKSLFYGVSDAFHEMLPFGSARQVGEDGEPILRDGEFWANRGVSFELRRGECLGLIGRNGAGKTTLLKMLNGLMKPDVGCIEMKGRIGAIIALGAGFNPILTGRENIQVNASILGLSASEVAEKMEEIIDFAEIGEFIDSPVQSYSSGMQVRLGFAVATAMEPDVLILDEVLAVGDSSFRTKCFLRISSMLSKAAVIFVSHSEETLRRICTTGLLLDKGRVDHAGSLPECLEAYHRLQAKDHAQGESGGFLDSRIERIDLVLPEESHDSGADLPLELVYEARSPLHFSLHVLALYDHNGSLVAVTDLMPFFNAVVQGVTRRKFVIRSLALRPGLYSFSLETLSTHHAMVLVRTRLEGVVRVRGSIAHWSSYTPLSVPVGE